VSVPTRAGSSVTRPTSRTGSALRATSSRLGLSGYGRHRGQRYALMALSEWSIKGEGRRRGIREPRMGA
jgi:hypothetical protein